MLTSDLAFRATALAASALLHVLLYGALSLAPAWSPASRTGLVVTDLIVNDPPPPALPARSVTPPRPLARPHPSKSRVESTPLGSASTIEPSIEREVFEPPAAPPAEPAIVAAGETTVREEIEGGDRSIMMSSPHPGPTVAALPQAPPAAAPRALTRAAIPRGGYQITPSYPATARQLGIEGTALLSVFVDADGRVAQVVVRQSAGHPDLDRAATDAVRRWRFEPARRGAEAVAMWVELPVDFRLR